MAQALIEQKAGFRRALLAWYRANARSLPWREAPSLYKTVVSEFMLQQTQVKTVLPYFARWLNEFPDFTALAAASEERVLKLWEGLGYYSRARNLHRLAREIAGRATLPRTPEEWRELPGVGPYTSAAITSIAFAAPSACVDGNVVRILSRITANSTEFPDSATAAKSFAPLAGELLNPAAPGDHNQAMMELGATICFRQKPLCLTCPVRAFCAAARAGDPEAYPRLAPKKMEQIAVTRVWSVHENSVLLHRAAAGAKRLAELHELPTDETLGLEKSEVTRGALLAKRKRGITRFHITESIHALTLTLSQRRAVAQNPGLRWIPLAELDDIALSGPHRRWITELLESECGQGALTPQSDGQAR